MALYKVGVYMDLDKIIDETRYCVKQLKRIDIEGKYEEYSIDRLMAEIIAETKQMKDERNIVPQIDYVTTTPIPYQENITHNRFIRKIDEKLSKLGIYRFVRKKIKGVYRYFIPLRTVNGKELLKYEGEEFARVAYKSILQREIDTEALINVVRNLEERKITKAEFLLQLCNSEEAQVHGIRVSGLGGLITKERLKRRIKRIPILGYCLRWIKCIVTLPRIVSTLQKNVIDLVTYDKWQSQSSIEQKQWIEILRRDLEFAVGDRNKKLNYQQELMDVLRRDLEFAVVDRNEKLGNQQKLIDILQKDLELFRRQFNLHEEWKQEQEKIVVKLNKAIQEQVLGLEEISQKVSEYYYEEKIKMQEFLIAQDEINAQLKMNEEWKNKKSEEFFILNEELQTKEKKLDELLQNVFHFRKETNIELQRITNVQDKVKMQLNLNEEWKEEQKEAFEKINEKLQENKVRLEKLDDRLLQFHQKQEIELQRLSDIQNELTAQVKRNVEWRSEKIQELVSLKYSLELLDKEYNEKLEALVKIITQNELVIKECSQWKEQQIQKEEKRNINYFEKKKLLDTFYVEYNEKLMNDSREEVVERQKQYLPFIDQHFALRKEENLVMIDLGCGEGEFIEVLNQNNYPAYGIDSNPFVISKVKEVNPLIRIEESGAMEYLYRLPDNSVDFISSFHMVEHLETEELLELLKEIYRVLKKGGCLILETPNPLNFLISSYYFYLDPTHKKPIPWELLKLMVSSTGLEVEECKMIRPLNFIPYSYDDPKDKLKDIIFRFNMEQAYSIMAVKK